MLIEKSPSEGARNVSINSLSQDDRFAIQFRSDDSAESCRGSTEAAYEEDSSNIGGFGSEEDSRNHDDDDESDYVPDEKDFDCNDEDEADALMIVNSADEDFDYYDDADAEDLVDESEADAIAFANDGDNTEDSYSEDKGMETDADGTDNAERVDKLSHGGGDDSVSGQDDNRLISQTSIIGGEKTGAIVQISDSENDVKCPEAINTSLSKAFDELAKLSPTVYEQIRRAKAKELGLRLPKLDDEVECRRRFRGTQKKANVLFVHWETIVYPSPVKGFELFDEIYELFKRFVVADEESLQVATMWIALTWLTDVATILPILMITAPEKNCGKSVFLAVLHRLCKNPFSISNVTNAAVFRMISTHNPTLLLDEADTFMKENRELTGIINSGHEKKAAYVLRCNPDTLEPEPFSTWGAKAIAGIKLEKLSSTLVSRSIIVPMRRKMAGDVVENIRHVKDDVFEVLRMKLNRWCLDNADEFSRTFPSIPQLQNRNMDNWEPLLAIARLAGGDWEHRITNAALKIEADFADESLEIKLLKDIYDIFDAEGCNDISTQDLIDMLCRKTESPWSTYNNGKPIGHNQLANKLRHYQICSKKFSSGLRGYSRDSFTETFARYIPDYINKQTQGCHSPNTVVSPVLATCQPDSSRGAQSSSMSEIIE